jgi:hypothetical protein
LAVENDIGIQRIPILSTMDFHSLPRRKLQTLCKKHGIPANSTNAEMATSLSDLFKVSTFASFFTLLLWEGSKISGLTIK